MSDSKTLALGDATSMNAKRRISANDISNSSVLSKTFIVAITRHDCGISSTSASADGARLAFGHESERLIRAGLGSVIGQHDRLAGQHREQLAERAVEVRAVELVDHEPLVRPDRLEEMALLELQRVRVRSGGARRSSRRSSSPRSRSSGRSRRIGLRRAAPRRPPGRASSSPSQVAPSGSRACRSRARRTAARRSLVRA